MVTKRRRRRTKFKYIMRRFILVAIILASVAVISWYIGRMGSLDNQPSSSTPILPVRLIPRGNPAIAPAPPGLNLNRNRRLRSNPPKAKPRLMRMIGSSCMLGRKARCRRIFGCEWAGLQGDFRVDERIVDDVKRMFARAKADGINLMIISAYRSVEDQDGLFEYSDASSIAKPNRSEHNTGLAMDILTPSHPDLTESFDKTPAFKWLGENAYKFGFVLRYPKNKLEITQFVYEPWHYRYVGEENAAKMREKAYCLEEYIQAISKAKQKALEDASTAEQGEDSESEPST